MNRTQAASEYLIVWGIVITVVVAVVATLFALGVFSPRSNLPSTVIGTFTHNVAVDAVEINSSSIAVNVVDNSGSSITVNSLIAQQGNTNYTISSCSGFSLSPGQSKVCRQTGSFVLPFNGHIFINYTSFNGVFNESHVSVGSLSVS